jgi:prevent-host-death family protein
MATVDACEAKTHFSALLERVVQGEEIVISRHGRPVARLAPAVGDIDAARIDGAIDTLERLRQGTTLGGLAWRALRDEGRR